MKLTLDELESLLQQAQDNPWAFFAKTSLKDMQVASHPDKWPSDRDRAQALFTGFGLEHDRSKSPQVIIKSPTREYKLTKYIATGDLRTVQMDQDGLIVKIPRVTSKQANNLIAKEAEILRTLAECPKNSQYQRYVPTLVETFTLKEQRINVTKHDDWLLSLADIHRRYPEGIDGRHIGWMMKRMLVAAGYAHSKGYVHGAITPEHALFCSGNHAGVLCGWIHAEKPGQQIKTVPATRKDWYPVDAKSGLTPAVDVYMIGRLMLSVLNPDECPKRLKAFIQATQLPASMRPADAWKLHDDLTDILRLVYGAPKFVELKF